MPELYSGDITCAPSEQSYWDGQSVITGTPVTVAPSDDQVQVSLLSFVFSRTTPSTFIDDVVVTSLAFVKDALAGATSYLLGSEKATVEGFADTMWTSLKVQVPAHYTLKEYRWHDYSTDWKKPGPATRVTTVGAAATGSSTNCVPDQVATSVTFKTASRLHWGRMYLPQLITTNYTSTGRIVSNTVDLVSGYLHTFLNACSGAALEPVVRSTSHRGTLGIVEIQMDNIPDVIRSRRAKQTDYRKIYTS